MTDQTPHPSGEPPAQSGMAGIGAGAGAEAAAGGALATNQASLWGDAWRQLRTNPLFITASAVIIVLIIIAAFPGLFTRTDPRICDLANSLEGPSRDHIFGFDEQGCDYYANVIHGARVSMVVGVLVVGSFSLIGIVLGALAGYYGGWVDAIIARITDIWFGIPTVLGAIVVLNALFANNRGIIQVSIVLVLLGWPTTLRLVRSSVLSVKEMDYVQAARALGAGDARILLRHILPNAIAPVIVYGTIAIGGIIAAEASLSFLGVGLDLPAISWGLMIAGAQTRVLESPHLLLFPGAFLSVTVLSFILMGDALRDALDPKLR